jgi:hypothetical protein
MWRIIFLVLSCILAACSAVLAAGGDMPRATYFLVQSLFAYLQAHDCKEHK